MKKPSLLDMTDIPMTNILEQCDFKSVLTLRKVCHSLRNFVDVCNFKTDLEEIWIVVYPDGSYFVKLASKFPRAFVSFRNLTSANVKTILNLQNVKLSEFHVYIYLGASRGLENLEEILKNKPHSIKTETFHMNIHNSSEVLKVLPHLDTKVLKNIRILPSVGWNASNCSIETSFDGTDQIVQLEHFKNVVEFLFIFEHSFNSNLRQFYHFERIHVRLQDISMEDLVALKKAFLTNTHMKEFVLAGHLLDDIEFEKNFGAPCYTYPSLLKQWYFKIPNCKKHVLDIVFCMERLTFQRSNVKHYPATLIIRD